MQGASLLAAGGPPSRVAWALGLLAIASGALVLIGLLTPCAGAVAGLSTMGIAAGWAGLPPGSCLIGPVASAFILTDAGILVLLGPGAHSMDACLFGRREIIIPRDSHAR